MTRNVTPARSPSVARTVGLSQPCSTEYLRKNTAARTNRTPAIHEKRLTPTSFSQSNGFFGGKGGAGGAGGGGGGRGGGGGSTTGGSAIEGGTSRAAASWSAGVLIGVWGGA